MKGIATETRDLIANSYLELVQISENTGAIIKTNTADAERYGRSKKEYIKIIGGFIYERN